MQLTIDLPFEALFILYQLQRHQHEGYLVGGAVRDILINALNQLNESQGSSQNSSQVITDFDFTTNALPEQIQKIFPESYYHNEFGMVGIGYQNLLEQLRAQGYLLPNTTLQQQLNQTQVKSERIIDLATATKVHESLQSEAEEAKQDASPQPNQLTPPPFEITTYRSEGVYHDFRRPSEIQWGQTVKQDLERRDFTINAMAISVSADFLSQIFEGEASGNQPLKNNYQIPAKHYKLVDEHHGLKDLAAGLIKTVGQPNDRFQEDALRMMRAVRFAAQLEMRIDPLTYQALKDNANLIDKISLERIRDEFLKMLTTPEPDRAIEILDKTGLLSHFLPELQQMKGVEQGGHHTTDVWTHALDAVKSCPSSDPIVRLATLLHDVGKPQTYQLKDGQITFYNHEIISSRIASKIGKRLRLSKKQQDRLFTLVRYHMFYYQPNHTDAAVRRIMKRVGLENIDDILDLREGDRLGSGARKTSWRLEELKQRMIDQLHQPFDVTDLAIDGHDLMDKLQIKPGPVIGDILKELTEKVLQEPELNTQQKLLELAKEIVEKSSNQ
ncbi:MAG: HDIG domain-containing protein [Candidatus Pacebacteria bacterium]|nr:HDIG domain-containing protein [Candidatus Paceibacterota bacterium]